MSENIKISLGELDIILNLPIELLMQISNVFTDMNFCQHERYDIKVINDDNENYIFLINKGLQEKCSKANVLFKLLIEIEQCYCDKLKIIKDSFIIFHGGLVSINGNGIMVIGKKEKGKSTLIALLSTEKDFFFCSDDIAVYSEDYFYGIPMPQRLRIPINKLMKNVFATTVDFQNEIRYLYCPQNCFVGPNISKLIIIPEYNVSKNYIKEICGFEKIMSLVNNIKMVDNMKNVYEAVKFLAKRVRMYKLYYYDNDWVVNKIKKIVNDTKIIC